MRSHRIKCGCTKGSYFMAVGSFLRDIVYWCRHCCTQKNVRAGGE